MDSSSAQQQQQHHHQQQDINQEMGLQTLESMLVCKDNKKARPADMQALKCPRCDSSNTKFCYYNNYSLSQPRYFCKSCRRYWTKGGTLRNVPVGGGCRKNKRSSSSSSSKPLPSMAPPTSDLNLAIARLHKQNPAHLGLEDRDVSIWGNSHPHADLLGTSSGLFDAIRSGVFDNHSGNLYYGMGNMEAAHEMGMPSSYGGVSSTPVKHEVCGGDADGKILWGFPWQNMNTAGDANGSDFDSARLNWSGIASSNWQGLLNSPLT